MTTSMRQGTLETLGLGTVHNIFKRGRLPADAGELVDRVFGKKGKRGALVISGAEGVVGAGKCMQLGSRLQPYGVPIVALDFPGAPDGIGRQYKGLVRGFGRERAARIMEGIIRMSYDGKRLPERLKSMEPKFLLEAIPEILEVKKAHYKLFKNEFPKIEIRSVTSGFPSSKLGVGVYHPAFPHEINKIWEVVEDKPSAVTQLFWALGMTPMPVGDHWSFVLDVLFCGITLNALRVHQASNMPYWKIDKHVRRLVGPNPLRAHDMIGSKGADFLTWSCLHHLSERYGKLFAPTPDLAERKETGQPWYPPNHFRPLVDWPLEGKDLSEFRTRILGPLFQMTSLMLHEKRAHLSHINSIGELCAQFQHGVLAMIRGLGTDATLKIVRDHHKLNPGMKDSWYPEVFKKMDSPSWRQLYVNAEHDGKIGVISIGRERYNSDVDAELNRAVDWLKKAKIQRVIVSGDFHLSSQMVGADTAEFFPALDDKKIGAKISSNWSKTARRLTNEFKTSVGYAGGKRCLGGFLELLVHCHYFVAPKGTELGLPEVTLPVVPGMEGTHWPFRKANPKDWPNLVNMLLTGESVRAEKTVGWLVDFSGSIDKSLQAAWRFAAGKGPKPRKLQEGILKKLPQPNGILPDADNPATAAARRAIMECARACCAKKLSEALTLQAKHSADFMGSTHCRKGAVGAQRKKAMSV